MSKKLLGTLSFAALMSAIMVRVFLQLAFGSEHIVNHAAIEADQKNIPAQVSDE